MRGPRYIAKEYGTVRVGRKTVATWGVYDREIGSYPRQRGEMKFPQDIQSKAEVEAFVATLNEEA